jgi:two-component system, cell cycle response regulator
MENDRELVDAQSVDTQTDWLTGVYNRPTLLAMLFRETDRAQRLNTPISLLLLDIDDFSHWNEHLGATACDQLLWLVAARTARLLRSYDLFGRTGGDEFLLSLPGCNAENAVLLAERLRLDVFSVPFHVADRSIRLSACFGISSSRGRSPLVVLREVEEALEQAKAAGPESIQIFGGAETPAHTPVTIFSPGAGDECFGS